MANRNAEQNVVRCDIGSFVVAVERLKILLQPAFTIYETFDSVIQWHSPLLSIVCLSVAMFIAANNPELLGNLIILPVPICLLLGLARRVGARKTSTTVSIYSLFKRRDENAEILAKKAAIQRAQEHLVIYMDILIAIQAFCNDTSEKLEAFYDIFNWKKPRVSLSVLFGAAGIILLLSILHTEHVAILIVLAVFLLNSGFKRTVLACLANAGHFVSLLMGFRFRHPTESSDQDEGDSLEDNIIDMVPDEFRTVENSETSGSSSDEPEPQWKKETDTELIAQPRPHKSRSMVSRIASFGRQRMKKWTSGNCMSCKVFFSTILKKRQYCRHCGYSFCSKCCHQRVPRAVFGATAPAAYEQTVLVCTSCHDFLINRMKSKNTELVE